MAAILTQARQKPLLSVVTINKNNDTGLARTIASFQVLRYNEDIDFVFVDGGSTDASLELALAFYASDNMVSGCDRGIYSAMNTGFELASADWILWINSGDEFLPDCWPLLRQELVASDSAVICGAAEIIHEKSGNVAFIKKSRPADMPWFMVNHSSSVFRRVPFLKYGMYNDSLFIAADRYLMVTLYLAGEKIQYIDLCISRFWLGGVSDKKQLLRAKENLYVDLVSGLITSRAYRFAMLRQYFYHRIVKPIVLTCRMLLQRFGLALPPLGKYAGFLGEPPRDR